MKMLKNPAGLWTDIGLVCVGMIACALFYQYFFDYQPCAICIHIRLWVVALFLICIPGMMLNLKKWPQLITWLFAVGASFGMAKSSWDIFSTERGWKSGLCSSVFDSGLPSWFPIHEWLPRLFKAKSSCAGGTPELMFSITMAEGLLFMSALLALVSIYGLVSSGYQLSKKEE